MSASTTTVVFDTKPYDRDSLQKATPNGKIDWRFMEFRLRPETAVAAQGAQAVCIFVNDHADHATLEQLHSAGVRHIALRCAGFNNVDLAAAKEMGFRSRASPPIRRML